MTSNGHQSSWVEWTGEEAESEEDRRPRLVAAARGAGKGRIRVLFASSEVYPLAKTGGLADVSAALPASLAGPHADIRLIMPGYGEALDLAIGKGPVVPLGDVLGVEGVGLIPAHLPDSGLPIWLVDCSALYCRPGGPYADDTGREWADNAFRFAVFSHVVAQTSLGAAGAAWQPDVVHLNDWHVGPVAALLSVSTVPSPATLLTIHNLAFQGLFPAEAMTRLGLPDGLFTSEGFEFYGQVSFLKAGIRFADQLTTVSPTYAREILTPEAGCGLDGLLRWRADDLVGILNGVDYASWTPRDQARLPFPYDHRDLSGKSRCKAAIQTELGLEPSEEAPVIAYLSRLTAQKMADTLAEVVPTVVSHGAQLAICGHGDASIEAALRAVAAENPRRVAIRSYDEGLARRVLAGADMLAAPSRFEPCGLVQLYAMRYGALPIVRRTGGLADTVVDQGNESEATGFTFEAATVADFAGAIDRACCRYRSLSDWRRMQIRAMQQDFGWKRSAALYMQLYRRLVALETSVDEPTAATRSCAADLRQALRPNRSADRSGGRVAA